MAKNWLKNWYAQRTGQLEKNAQLPLYPFKAVHVYDRKTKGLKIQKPDWRSNLSDYINTAINKIKIKQIHNAVDIKSLPKDVLQETRDNLENPGHIDGKYYFDHGIAVLMPWGRPTIGVHEVNHGIALPSEEARIQLILGQLPKDEQNKPFITTRENPNNYFTDWLNNHNSDDPFYRTSDYNSYFEDPDEIRSRLMEFRYYNKIDPQHTFTLDEIQDMRKRAKNIFDYLESYNQKGSVYKSPNDGDIVDFNLFERYDDNTLLRLFNEVAYTPNQNKQIYNARLGGSLNYFNYFK